MQFVRPQAAKLLFGVNKIYYSSVSVVSSSSLSQTLGIEPSAKACPCNPCFIILHTVH